MALHIKGADAVKRNLASMKKVGCSPQGKDYFDVERMNNMLDSLYKKVDERKSDRQSQRAS
tara:strand:+ start:2763 stop:2945 length:183 start_codon:yes stop_codon:yes gene_type:complete